MKTLLTCCQWKSANLGTVEVNGKSQQQGTRSLSCWHQVKTRQSFGEKGYVYGGQFPEVCSAAVAVEQQHEITLGHYIVGNNRLLL